MKLTLKQKKLKALAISKCFEVLQVIGDDGASFSEICENVDASEAWIRYITNKLVKCKLIKSIQTEGRSRKYIPLQKEIIDFYLNME